MSTVEEVGMTPAERGPDRSGCRAASVRVSRGHHKTFARFRKCGTRAGRPAMATCRRTGTSSWTHEPGSNDSSTKEIVAALVHYHLGYIDWRLSSLVYMSTGISGQAPYLRRGVTELGQAVALQPDFADAHALIAMTTGALIGSDPSEIELLRPRLQTAWKAALQPEHSEPARDAAQGDGYVRLTTRVRREPGKGSGALAGSHWPFRT